MPIAFGQLTYGGGVGSESSPKHSIVKPKKNGPAEQSACSSYGTSNSVTYGRLKGIRTDTAQVPYEHIRPQTRNHVDIVEDVHAIQCYD